MASMTWGGERPLDAAEADDELQRHVEVDAGPPSQHVKEEQL